VDGRLIARTGEIDLQVPDVQRAFDAAGALADRQGGFVSDSNNQASTAGAGEYEATLTLRVPASRFLATMAALAALPHHTLQEQSASQDLTESYHDLQASLQALAATRVQLLALMRQARKVADAITVLDRLTDVDTHIDSVQAQIAASANSVLLSTITVNLSPEPQPVLRPAALVWLPGRALAAALTNVGLALQTIATAAIYGATYLALPLIVLALALGARRVWRLVLHP
jgi:hypothetical protein